MKRQINNLLFLFGFILALSVGRTDYVNFGRSMLANIDSKLSKTHEHTNKVAEQNNYKRALPAEAFLSAHQSFMEGKYINKSFGTKRIGPQPGHYQDLKTTPMTNYGRDGP